MEEIRERLTRWTEEASRLLEALAREVDDRDRLTLAAESAQRECRRVKAALEASRAEVAALRQARVEAADALAIAIDQAGRTLRRLQAMVPEDALQAAPAPADPPAEAHAASAQADGAPVISAGPGPIEAAVAPVGREAAGMPGTRRRILLADDDVDFRTLLTDYLATHRGYDVAAVGTGEAALETLRHTCPDAILLDVAMPGIGGVETLRQIKALYPHLTVVMISADQDLTIARKALLLGAVDYLTKPCDLDYLDAALDIHLAAGGRLAAGGAAAVRVDSVTASAPARDTQPPERQSRSWFAR